MPCIPNADYWTLQPEVAGRHKQMASITNIINLNQEYLFRTCKNELLTKGKSEI